MALLAALTTPFATLAHLAAEAASLGGSSPRVLLSPHHAYLAALNVAAAIALPVALGLFSRSAERRRRIALFVASLPGRGRGPAFAAATLSLQLGFFATTQLLEGDPIAAGHLALGLLAALFASLAGTLIIARAKLRILRALVALTQWLDASITLTPAILAPFEPVVAFAQLLLSLPGVSSRPPPLFAI